MRKFLTMLVVTAVAGAGMPGALAAEDSTVAVMGTAYTVNMQPLSNSEVQIRNLKTGYRVGSTRSDANGGYTFKNMRPGTYVIEIVNAEGKVLGMSAPFVLDTTPTVQVSVVAVGHGAAAAGANAKFNVLGLGPVTSLAVVGAASAAAVTAVVATKPDASPSK